MSSMLSRLFGRKRAEAPTRPEPPEATPVVAWGPPFPDLWRSEPEFEAIDAEIRGHTLVTKDRCFMLWQFARETRHLDGDVAELGVYKGGTAKLLARVLPKKRIHLLDTFAGMPETDAERDVHRLGDFNDTSLEAVRSYLADCPNVEFHPGFFPDSAASLPEARYSLVYIDADIYRSTLDALEYFYPRMVKGGVMIFDDYEWPNCPGVKTALDEFLAGRPERQIVTTNYQSMLIKW